MRIPPRPLRHFLFPILASAGLSNTPAAVVGFEDFSYANGSVVGQAGGQGWNYERTDEAGAPPQSASNWDSVSGAAQVVNGMLVTNGTSAKREFGGATSGSAAGTNEREGAFRGAGVVYFSATYSVSALLGDGASQWGGISSYDFGSERVFFGMPSQTTATRYFGVIQSGTATALSTVPVVAGQTYSLVGALDFDSDLIKLWINPDAADFDSGLTHSADITLPYTATNWSSAVRLGSVAGADISWDNLKVTTTFAEAAVPEPSGTVLASLALSGLLAKRRRRLA